MKVLVCDDLKPRCEEAVKAIEEADQNNIKIVACFGNDLKAQLEALFENVAKYLDGGADRSGVKSTAFDDASLVIIDNNLAHLGIGGTRLTAESVAGYVRAFTSAPYVISLNKNPDVDFDLRYLVGDYTTRADLAINDRHLSNPGLWTGKPADASNGFLPWYWPVLSSIAEKRRAQLAFVRDKLDKPVLGALGIPDDAIPFLSLHAKGALSPSVASDDRSGDDGTPIGTLTFRDVFVASNRSLPHKSEREKLSEQEKTGDTALHEIICRVVAADIDLWVRRDVLAPQEALVDVPHLLMRMPFLLGSRGGDIDQWNNAATMHVDPFGLEQSLFNDHLATTKFEHEFWVRSPSFWWSKLKADGRLNELFFAAGQEWPDLVFCEDRSVFLNRSPEESGAPIEFMAEFEGSWSHRYVSRIEGIRYTPRSRFAV